MFYIRNNRAENATHLSPKVPTHSTHNIRNLPMETTFEFACYTFAILFILWLRYTPETAQALVTEETQEVEMTEEITTEETFPLSISDPWEESVTIR
jgi:hypothetical protein